MMKRTRFHHIITAFIALTAFMLSQSGCSGVQGDEPVNPNGPVTVSFRVVTPRPDKSRGISRATWGDPYNPDSGSDFDNLLLRDQLRVIVTDNSCRNEIAVTNLICSRITESENEVSYDFLGRISAADNSSLKTLKNGKLHILANAGTVSSLDNQTTFTLASNQPGDDFKGIPMWGVATVDFSGIKESERFDAGKVELLRAFAKVEVLIAADDSDPKEDFNIISVINSASISRRNTAAYLLPEGWNNAKNTIDVVKDSKPLRVMDSPAGPTVMSPSADRKSLLFYLPECLNTQDNELFMTLSYDSETDYGKTDNIYFCDYGSDGKPDRAKRYDIRRNHLYRFIVRRNGNGLAVTADVVPYKSVELDPGFGLDQPEPAAE